jgi:hypothetical protein
MNCRLRQIKEDGSILTLTCDEVRKNQFEMKAEFRKNNRTDEIIDSGRVDRMYKEYCESISNFLDQCKCVDKIPLRCEKCSIEDHEGDFCRCESRNIALAKQLRREKSELDRLRKEVSDLKL